MVTFLLYAFSHFFQDLSSSLSNIALHKLFIVFKCTKLKRSDFNKLIWKSARAREIRNQSSLPSETRQPPLAVNRNLETQIDCFVPIVFKRNLKKSRPTQISSFTRLLVIWNSNNLFLDLVSNRLVGRV